jgi:hypothetical protein
MLYRAGRRERRVPVARWAGLALLVACESRDPILDRVDAMEKAGEAAPGVEPTPVNPEAPAPAAVPAPAPGQAEEPPPGMPEAPSGDMEPAAEGEPEEPEPGIPEEPEPGMPGGGDDQGPTVKISGRVILADWKQGEVRIDAFDGDQVAAASKKGQQPRVVSQTTIARPGEFELYVPVSAGRVWLGAVVDEDQDGRPGPLDPAAWYSGNPVDATVERGGVVIELIRRPPPPRLE